MVLNFGGTNILFNRGFTRDDSGTQLSDWKFIVQNGIQISAEDTGGSGTVTLYTVPAGKIFYLFNASMGFEVTTDFSSFARINANGKSILMLNTGKLDGDVGNITISLPVPIKLIAGQTITGVGFSANIENRYLIYGYELNAGTA